MTARIRVQMDNRGITELLTSQSSPVYKDFFRRVLKVHGRARANCGVDTGRLRSSIRYNVHAERKGLLAVVGTDVEYALWHHDGTKAHVIRPKAKKALFWKGARHPVRGVNHPGTKGNPFLTDALKEVIN